jgi:hypothetical protein
MTSSGDRTTAYHQTRHYPGALLTQSIFTHSLERSGRRADRSPLSNDRSFWRNTICGCPFVRSATSSSCLECRLIVQLKYSQSAKRQMIHLPAQTEIETEWDRRNKAAYTHGFTLGITGQSAIVWRTVHGSHCTTAALAFKKGRAAQCQFAA